MSPYLNILCISSEKPYSKVNTDKFKLGVQLLYIISSNKHVKVEVQPVYCVPITMDGLSISWSDHQMSLYCVLIYRPERSSDKQYHAAFDDTIFDTVLAAKLPRVKNPRPTRSDVFCFNKRLYVGA